jgi:hypothetical protein
MKTEMNRSVSALQLLIIQQLGYVIEHKVSALTWK